MDAPCRSPKLSVVIPCYNAVDTLGAQLEALAAQQWSEPWELIIRDNGSTDKSVELAERYRHRIPCLRIVDASDRKGAAHARNIGALATQSKLLAFCDADDVVARGWLKAMGEALQKHNVVACRLDVDKLNPPWFTKILPPGQSESLPRPAFLCGLSIVGEHSRSSTRCS